MSILKKKGLGRGLSSLIGDSKSSSVKNKISISEIVRGKFQPRKIFNKEGKSKKVTVIETNKPNVIIKPKSMIGFIPLKIKERKAHIVVNTV